MTEYLNVEHDASARDVALMAAVRIAVGAFSALPRQDATAAPTDT